MFVLYFALFYFTDTEFFYKYFSQQILSYVVFFIQSYYVNRLQCDVNITILFIEKSKHLCIFFSAFCSTELKIFPSFF